MSVPWQSVEPKIKKWRKEGIPWQEIADGLSAEYGTAVSVESVRYHASNTSSRASTQVSDEYRYVLPGSHGSKGGREGLREALRAVAAVYGSPQDAPSIEAYNRYRNVLADRSRFPAVITFTRRYGSWNAANKDAGLRVNETRRSYEGLKREDIVNHLAHWLRSLDGGVASAARYRLWTKSKRQVPSLDTCRLHGSWNDLIEDAALLEQSGRKLPEVKPVQRLGRRKAGKARRLR